ncbi:hypothetical protein D9756_008143 [Leucocoprinus leucothites]|uniref:Uncharacterized protein n=1 Tax=Leucocoprinus leucothites TaxID=201217 RepID=A0A8H5D661_9AGAR|nr:hypothetical protein D9756_008143 [Leucoagaricus leucothites]
MPESSAQYKVPAPRQTPLPWQTPVSSPLIPLPLPQLILSLQPSVLTPSTAPARALPDPEPLNPAPPTLSPDILPPTAFSPPRHVHACEMFRNAHDFVLNNPQFNHYSPAAFGELHSALELDH